jgi:cyclic-di-GMP phosphodiesterase TipF (flagellum assembly factor)
MLHAMSTHRQNMNSWQVLLSALGAGAFLAVLLGAAAMLFAPAMSVSLIALAALSGVFATCSILFFFWTREQKRLQRHLVRVEQTAGETILNLNSLRGRLLDLEERLPQATVAPQDNVKAELKVLQELLAQVVSKRMATPSASSDSLNRREPELAIPGRKPDSEVLAVMRAALEDSRVDLYLQPIVRLPSRRIAHYEAVSRVRDESGEVILPSDYLRPAEAAGLSGTLDNVLLFRCVSLVRQLGPRRQGMKIFVNLAPASLREPGFLREFVGFMRQNRDLAQRLVFEIAADDMASFGPHVYDELAALARLGFGFSIDSVTHLDFEPHKLAAWNVQFVKVDASLLLGDSATYQNEDVKELLARYNIELIATRIETEKTVLEVLDQRVDYAQGYLFGGPRPARADLTNPKAA